MQPGERSFTVEASSTGFTGGRFENKIPMNAASKAANGIFDEEKSKGRNTKTIKVQLRETTQGSPDSLFAYEANRVDKVKKVMIKGKEITFRKNIELKSIDLFHGDGAKRQQEMRNKKKAKKTSK
jgi:hypothetical protein